MSGLDDHNYTNLPSGATPAPSPRIISANEVPGATQQADKKVNKLSRLSNLALIAGVMIFVGSIAFAIQRSTTGTKAKADTNANLVVANGIATAVLTKDMLLTKDIANYPKTFKGKAIDPLLITEGNEKYAKFSGEEQKKYVINRIILYYALTEALKENGLPVNAQGDSNFYVLSNNVKILRSDVRKNLLSTADYMFIKADYSRNRDYAPAAKASIEKYHDMLVGNPSGYRSVLKEANLDVFLRGINHSEENDYVTNYTDDDNEVMDQVNFVFDQAFDDVLFKLTANQVSPVFAISGQVPYAYVVVYPTKIEKKKYQKTADIIKEKLSLFTF